MSNTLAAGLALVSQRGFQSFKEKLAPMMAFSTSFSDEAAQKSASVQTQVITGVSASSFTSYESGNTTTTAKTVTLNQHSVAPLHLTDVEAGKTPVDVLAAQAIESAYAVANAVNQYVLGLFLAATYGDTAADKLTVAAASFDADDVADLVKLANDKNIPESNRSLILDNSAINALQKDNAIQNASALGSSEVIREGSVGRLLGCDVYRATLPSGITDENTYGMLVHPSSMAVAGRPVFPQTDDIEFELVSDEETGLSLGFRRHYKRSDGSYWLTAEWLYGAKAVQSTGAVRLVSA